MLIALQRVDALDSCLCTICPATGEMYISQVVINLR